MGSMSNALNTVIDNGLAAVEAEDIATAQRFLQEALRLGGENQARVLHLSGMIAWAEGRLDDAAGYLIQAVDMEPKQPEIYLDCAECLLRSGHELREAEAAIRVLLQLEDVPEQSIDEAKLLLAQIRFDDDDAEEALEILDDIRGVELRKHPAYLSTHGVVLAAAGKTEEAVAALEQAVASDPRDSDIYYQLGFINQQLGNTKKAQEAMLQVLKLDTEENQHEPLTMAEIQDLQAKFTQILAEIPETERNLVSDVPVIVQERATPKQVQEGMNPRSTVAFVGRPKTNQEDARLDSIVLLRDLLLAEMDDEEDIPELLIVGLFEEIHRFFQQSKFDQVEIVT